MLNSTSTVTKVAEGNYTKNTVLFGLCTKRISAPQRLWVVLLHLTSSTICLTFFCWQWTMSSRCLIRSLKLAATSSKCCDLATHARIKPVSGELCSISRTRTTPTIHHKSGQASQIALTDVKLSKVHFNVISVQVAVSTQVISPLSCILT